MLAKQYAPCQVCLTVQIGQPHQTLSSQNRAVHGAQGVVLGGLSLVPGPLSSILEVYACLLPSFPPFVLPFFISMKGEIKPAAHIFFLVLQA